MDLRQFAAFLFGPQVRIELESTHAVRFAWGPAAQTIRAEEHHVHPSLIRSPACPLAGPPDSTI